MKVKCTKFLSPLFDGTEIEDYAFLTIGKEYIVLGIHSNKNGVTIYIENNDKVPGVADIRQFEIISNYIPSNWAISYNLNADSLLICPKSWNESEDFWDKFYDEDDIEFFELYKKERDLIYQEESIHKNK